MWEGVGGGCERVLRATHPYLLDKERPVARGSTKGLGVGIDRVEHPHLAWKAERLSKPGHQPMDTNTAFQTLLLVCRLTPARAYRERGGRLVGGSPIAQLLGTNHVQEVRERHLMLHSGTCAVRLIVSRLRPNCTRTPWDKVSASSTLVTTSRSVMSPITSTRSTSGL